jgi:predicted acetyltransferase
MTTVDLAMVGDGNRPALDRLYQLYRHDLSEFSGAWPGDDGLFASRLERWLALPGTAAYLVEADGRLAGFAVVRPYEQGGWSLAEFFVVRAARRGGVGGQAARLVLGRHPGSWNIAFQEENPRAARFWRRLAASVDDEVREERVPVPGRPDLPPDVWLRLTVPAAAAQSDGDGAAAS